MKKRLLLSLLTLFPSVSLFGITRNPTVLTETTTEVAIPVQDLKKVTNKDAQKILDLVIQAQDLENADDKFTKLQDALELKTQSNWFNTYLSDLSKKISTIKTTQDISTLVPAIKAIHNNLNTLPAKLKAANISINLQKAADNLKQAFADALIVKAQELNQKAQELTDVEKQKNSKLALGLIYELTDGGDKKLQDLRTKASDLHDALLKNLGTKKQQDATIKEIESSIILQSPIGAQVPGGGIGVQDTQIPATSPSTDIAGERSIIGSTTGQRN